MGAWSMQILASDHDLHGVLELDLELKLLIDDICFRGMNQLAVKDGHKEDDNDPLAKSDSSIYAKQCSMPQWTRIRVELEKSTITQEAPSDVERLIAKYTAATKAQHELKNPYGDAYKTVILGACFMTLG